MNDPIAYIEQHSTDTINKVMRQQAEIVELLNACMRAKATLTLPNLDSTTRDLIVEHLGDVIKKHQDIVTICEQCGRCWIAKNGEGTTVKICMYCESP